MIQPKVKVDKRKRAKQKEKIVICFIYLVLAFAIIVLFFTAKSVFFPTNTVVEETTNQGIAQVPTVSRMSLTPFDITLAKQFMDKNNDGKCDVCGMDVNVCIESGQMQCNMGSESSMGVLGSQHIHADFKVYINDQPVYLSDRAHMNRIREGLPVSSFIHVDSGAPTPEKTGDVLHMHATGVPLWIFFESIELELPDGMKAYVNGKEISDYKNYVFNDLDKILITDGVGNPQEELNSITDFAGKH